MFGPTPSKKTDPQAAEHKIATDNILLELSIIVPFYYKVTIAKLLKKHKNDNS